ncbi:glycosyltransferase involved in cell wall biosynthesis [Azospirillum fermentarium]|uniref:glycosyltransferase family 4 protein n=1 Tax=Azospirillum fermentarium TaxID=1233114 RepID=UPI0022274033|nr:glycosyltransferase family 4 protein [Azospirillum fermentarium]MCW2249493.1 glycosyltransferase involved in cell wall biosynthesis [Azospirillum fermentarium]
MAANTGIVTAWARYGSGTNLHCVTPTPDDARKLLELLKRHELDKRPLVRFSSYAQSLPQNGVGTLFRLDPNLTDMLWTRRISGAERAFSICGLTHTLSPTAVIEWMSYLTVGPAQPWDALVCTSRAARSLVTDLCEQWREYLGERVGATHRAPVHLPVIPLGIDTAPLAHDPAKRATLRTRLGIGEQDVALLFSGRLSFFEKAHPAPMFIAAELAQARTDKKLHLMLAGRFPDPAHEALYRREAAELAPSVTLHILDGADPELFGPSRSAADLFISLSDNLQETFGLTPVEAMAAGLPALVSDWDGYRDTVDDGVTGVRIPVLMPPAGTGEAISSQHYIGRDYYRFLGQVSQRTAVDLEAAAAAIAALANDPARRRAMGQAGVERARRLFDWSVVIPQYEALWAELRAIREAAAPGSTLAPVAPDPFRLYASFATAAPDPTWAVTLMPGWQARFAVLKADDLARVHAPVSDNYTGIDHMLAQLDRSGRSSVGDIQATVPANAHAGVLHLLLWLMKMGIIRLTPPGAAR